ncbi:protein turtle-like isoform X1 [Dermacentor silvarum]|uniref:protein turtle-like isoform X1 n=1 Tax=Dermacentor silvarum TaxID=543639 RepID=UPI001899D289|nr:protein turtle-like isoform X1 [Dermacentor silvarum]
MIVKQPCLLVALLLCLRSPQSDASGMPSQEPEHMTALLGQDVILHCPFEYPDGMPVPYLVQWHKKDHKIPIYIWYDGYPPHAADDYKERISLSGQSSLNLTNVRESDKGWYECKVFFLNRETIRNGTWIYLDVLAPPHFKSKPEQIIYVKVGESVVLPCEAEGTPPPTIIWYKDNLPLEESTNTQIHPTELRISNLRQTDVGDYTCMARNSEGSDSALAKVIVAGPAVITTPPQNLTKLEGNFAEFVCEARALPSNITHRWFYNGVEISKLTWLQTRTLVRQDGTLFINPTAADDSGFYTCEISNGIGQPESATAYLNIEYPARVNFTPAFQYMPLNLSGVVRCYIQANPPIQFVTWFKDNRPFEANALNGVVNLSNGSLFFQRVSYEHQGRYLCSPFNIHSTGGSSAVMEVLVREPPMFSVKPKELYQQPRNTEVTMPCEGKGHPPPTISWRRADGKKLPKNRHSVSKGKLTIRSLQKEDHGRYECVLQNDVATLVTSTLLLVESTTPHAPTNVSVNTSAFAATVSWLPGYDGGHPQTYVLWYRLVGQGDAEWRTIRVYPDNAITLTIHNLQPESQYEFQVLSRNAFGDGLYSDIVRANTTKWNYIEGAYPTDAYGSTYIPTVNRTPTAPRLPPSTSSSSPPSPSPSPGPKPSAPRNVTVRETSAGVLVTWLPPVNSSVPIAFYCVEYRSPDKPWARSTNIMTGSEYTITDLPEGTKFYIRVSAFSITSAFESSPEILLTLAGCCVSDRGPKYKRDQAIISGVVGGVLFFIVAIILSVCAVKICNKRKRRKAEKAYMMVTCPVADARNGGHSHGGSPVSLKKHPEGRVPGVAVTGVAGPGPWWPVPPEPPPAAPTTRRPAIAATTPRASSPGLQLLLQGFPDDLSPVSGGDRSLPSTVPSSAAFSTPPSREPPCGFRPIHAPPAIVPRASVTTGNTGRQPPLATSSPPCLGYKNGGSGYTRERLLGAVQRVRCTALRHHSAPELQMTVSAGSTANAATAAVVALRPDSASLTSGSSGRGSSAGAARGDSLQGELRPAAANLMSSSLVPPRDQSVDENYEFDPALSPALGDDDDAWRGLSDSELYSTAWDAETRCAALKREFLRRRRRPLESAC